MLTVWKYAVEVSDFFVLDLPVVREVLHVAGDPDRTGWLLFWVKVNDTSPTEPVTFEVYGTGHPLGITGKHLGTVFDGPFVWHIFEVRS